MALITKDNAYMWTDGRFYIQIEKELYPGWKMKKWEAGSERITTVILREVPKGSTIAFDFKLVTNSK
ncbi:MAG: aminopeptidase P family N-terminal domain-containing protein [archaeon]|nr:aminopeptidase P family N-terminal domain-containing protein [archaeon]